MFSVAEKQKIAQVIENVLKEINHPEINNQKPCFHLAVVGKEPWSFAEIHPNHEPVQAEPNPWNEIVRDILEDADKQEQICENRLNG